MRIVQVLFSEFKIMSLQTEHRVVLYSARTARCFARAHVSSNGQNSYSASRPQGKTFESNLMHIFSKYLKEGFTAVL